MEPTESLFGNFKDWFSWYVANYGLSFEINGNLFKDFRIIYDMSFNLECHQWSFNAFFMISFIMALASSS
jgi:hypothetical protein